MPPANNDFLITYLCSHVLTAAAAVFCILYFVSCILFFVFCVLHFVFLILYFVSFPSTHTCSYVLTAAVLLHQSNHPLDDDLVEN